MVGFGSSVPDNVAWQAGNVAAAHCVTGNLCNTLSNGRAVHNSTKIPVLKTRQRITPAKKWIKVKDLNLNMVKLWTVFVKMRREKGWFN